MDKSNAERTLEEKEHHMRLFMESTSDCFWNWNMVSNEVERSIGFERAFGYEKEEILPGIEWWIDRLHPDDKDKVLKTFEFACNNGKKNTEYEYRFRRKDGSYAIINDHVCIIRKEDKVVRSLGAMHDITQRKEVEEQLRQAQKMESLGTLTGGVAHEFNNLLLPILGYTELLLSDKSENDPDTNFLKLIQLAGERAKELIQQLLAYGRQSLSQRDLLQLDTVIDDVISLIQHTTPSNISIKKEIDIGLPPIFGMPNEIHQIILNLCINACHAMPEGGELVIRLKRQDQENIRDLKREPQDGEFLDLIVQDTGLGMDKMTLDRIFDPFFTTKDVGQGSGLGLSVVQGIVEQHQGHIEVESEAGKGSIFHIYLPTSGGKIEPQPIGPETLRRGKERILLIDDEVFVIDLAKSMLEKLGYKVSAYLEVYSALDQFSKNSQLFDLVITDYGMPKMNGKMFAEKIKEARPDIPIILLTGYGDLVARENIHQWGMEDILLKPFRLRELSDSVTKVLEKKRATIGDKN